MSEAGHTRRAPGKLHKSRRRRHHSRPSVLRRLVQAVGCEFRAMLRTPLYRWSFISLLTLGLLFWLLGIVLPSSNPYRSRLTPQGQLTR